MKLFSLHWKEEGDPQVSYGYLSRGEANADAKGMGLTEYEIASYEGTDKREDQSSRVAQFDTAIQKVTQERGSVYGPPNIDFERANKLKIAVAECKDPLARHALEMICGKIARLIQTPDHLDSWIDIAGYARCGVMVTETGTYPPKS